MLAAISAFRVPPNLNFFPIFMLRIMMGSPSTCESPRVGYLKRFVVASGFDCVPPTTGTSAGPNRGSLAATLVRIAPDQGPAVSSHLAATVMPAGATQVTAVRIVYFFHVGPYAFPSPWAS